MSDIEIQECEYPTTPGLYWATGVDWRGDTYVGIAYYDSYMLRDLANEWHFVSPPNVPDEYDESKLYSCEPLTVVPTELLDQMRAKDEWTETWALLNYGPLTLIHTPKEPS